MLMKTIDGASFRAGYRRDRQRQKLEPVWIWPMSITIACGSLGLRIERKRSHPGGEENLPMAGDQPFASLLSPLSAHGGVYGAAVRTNPANGLDPGILDYLKAGFFRFTRRAGLAFDRIFKHIDGQSVQPGAGFDGNALVFFLRVHMS
jgi:hypothetical protein